MKIQIDTNEKIVRIEENINLGEFFSQMEMLFPDLKWREYTLEAGTIINWTDPIPFPVYPIYPQDYPWITYTGDAGVYNVNLT